MKMQKCIQAMGDWEWISHDEKIGVGQNREREGEGEGGHILEG